MTFSGVSQQRTCVSVKADAVLNAEVRVGIKADAAR